MESKNLWVTVFIAAIVALGVSFAVLNTSGVSLSPATRGLTATSGSGNIAKAPTPTQMPMPDLSISSMSIGGFCYGPNRICNATIVAFVKNIGTGNATAGLSLTKFTLQPLSGNGTAYQTYVSTPALSVGQEVGLLGKFSYLPPGIYLALTNVDALNQVNELNENNNVAMRNITLS